MRRKTSSRPARSSGNVFADLLFIRSDLLIRLQEEIKRRGLKQAEAAKLLGITQPRVSDLVRARLDLFSTDALIDLLARLGIRVRLLTSRSSKVA